MLVVLCFEVDLWEHDVLCSYGSIGVSTMIVTVLE